MFSPLSYTGFIPLRGSCKNFRVDWSASASIEPVDSSLRACSVVSPQHPLFPNRGAAKSKLIGRSRLSRKAETRLFFASLRVTARCPAESIIITWTSEPAWSDIRSTSQRVTRGKGGAARGPARITTAPLLCAPEGCATARSSLGVRTLATKFSEELEIDSKEARQTRENPGTRRGARICSKQEARETHFDGKKRRMNGRGGVTATPDSGRNGEGTVRKLAVELWRVVAPKVDAERVRHDAQSPARRQPRQQPCREVSHEAARAPQLEEGAPTQRALRIPRRLRSGRLRVCTTLLGVPLRSHPDGSRSRKWKNKQEATWRKQQEPTCAVSEGDTASSPPPLHGCGEADQQQSGWAQVRPAKGLHLDPRVARAHIDGATCAPVNKEPLEWSTRSRAADGRPTGRDLHNSCSPQMRNRYTLRNSYTPSDAEKTQLGPVLLVSPI
ncbi:hypothetical protein MRX96_005139 [Rhipicephalus microplus]